MFGHHLFISRDHMLARIENTAHILKSRFLSTHNLDHYVDAWVGKNILRVGGYRVGGYIRIPGLALIPNQYLL